MAWSVYGGTFGGLGPGAGSGAGAGAKGASTGIPSVNVSAESTAELDRALERAQQGAVGAQRAYWKLAMDRPQWIFLCNAEHAKAMMEKPEAERAGGGPQPLLWSMNGKTMIGVFTSEAAAMETHRQMHNAGPETKNEDLPPAAMLSMPVPDAIAWISQVPADKVTDIVVNRRANVTVAHMPIAMLPGLYEWATDTMPDQLWDLFIKSVQQSNQPGGWARLRNRFTTLNTWWLPGDPGGSNMPLVVVDKERKFLVVATHAGAAQRAYRLVVQDPAAQARIGPIPREQLAKLLEAVNAEPNGPKDVAVNLGGSTAGMKITDLVTILRAAPAPPTE